MSFRKNASQAAFHGIEPPLAVHGRFKVLLLTA